MFIEGMIGLGGAEIGSVCFSGSLFVFLITVFGHADLAADRVVCQMEEAVFDFVEWVAPKGVVGSGIGVGLGEPVLQLCGQGCALVKVVALGEIGFEQEYGRHQPVISLYKQG